MSLNQTKSMEGVDLSFQKSGTRESARYVSDTSVCEEGLQDGRWLGLYWSSTGQVQRENISATLPGMSPTVFPLHAFDLEIDGQDLRNRWNWVRASERPGKRGTREAVVELNHQVRPVSVKIVTRLDGTPFLTRYLEITNTGSRPAALSRVSPWSGMLWTWNMGQHWGELPQGNRDSFSLGYYRGLSAGNEGDFGWEVLPKDVRRIEGSNGKSGFGNPFFAVKNNLTGEMAIGSLAWSGNWFMEFWRDPFVDLSGQPCRGENLAFRMGPLGAAPMRVMEPVETIISPEMHLAVLHAGMDECVAALHRHLRASVIPARPKGKEFFSVAGRVVEEQGPWILKEIDIAAEMGVDAFMVDAGWYGDTFAPWPEKRGDWQVGSWIPGGLEACRQACVRHNIKFGLWMEPEVVGFKSNLRRDHPDWLLRTDGGRAVEKALDLSNPEAAKFMTDSVLRVIREHKLDFFKIDYNVSVNEGGQRERHGLVENELWRHYETLYHIFDLVNKEMPDVALECCSSGGGRNDLGMMSRFHYACESDFSMFPRSIRAINGLTLFIPPESLCYYHNHMPMAHQKVDLDTHLRVTLFAQTVFVGFGAQDASRTTQYFQKTKRYIKLAKDFTGSVIAGHPKVFHHTPDIGLSAPADWCVLEYSAQDLTRGYAGLFKLTSGSEPYRLRLKGVDRGAEYKVTMDNDGHTFKVCGHELAGGGLVIKLDAAMTSELVFYTKTDRNFDLSPFVNTDRDKIASYVPEHE